MSTRISQGWQIVFGAGAVLILVSFLGARTARDTAARTMKVPVQDQGIAADQPLTRYDLSSKNADITSLRQGVLAMMKLDCKEGLEPPDCEEVDGGTKPDGMLSPLGWKYQASIHGMLPGAIKQTAWNTCEHSSWFFLSWHRMELYFFERVLRKMSGNDKLTLAYWNFSDQPKLPADFRMKMIDGKANVLWWKFRNPKLNIEDKPLCPQVVATDKAFSQPAFFFTNVWQNGSRSFGGGAYSKITDKRPVIHAPGRAGAGKIERAPHDRVHVAVGNGNVRSMSVVAGSGLDPIFWPIHANIDRAWSCWQEKHPGTEPKSDIWMTTTFSFYDVQDAAPGYKLVEKTGKQIIDTAKQLGYAYDSNCTGFQLPKNAETAQSSSTPGYATTEAPGSVLTATAQSHAILAAEPVTVSIHLPSEVQERIETLVRSNVSLGSILLTVGGLTVDRPIGAAYGIYLNLPEGAEPDHQSEYYVDNLSFFGVGDHQHDDAQGGHATSEGNSISYDITDVVRQLVANGAWQGDQITVTFANTAPETDDCAEVPAAPADARARLAYVSLTVE